jgi:tRNA pseudouridine synthase
MMVGRGEEQPDVVRQLLDVEAVPGKPQYVMAPEVGGVQGQAPTHL